MPEPVLSGERAGGKGGEEGERRKKACKCTLDAEGMMERGGNRHERVWQIKASPFVLLLCR